MKEKMKSKITQVISLVICVLMIMAVSIRRDNRLLGHELKETARDTTEAVASDTVRTEADGTLVINTTSLASDVTGFGGTVPLEIYVKDNKVVKVVPLENTETPEFFEVASDLLTKWNGLTLEDASKLKVDAVSGATYSSNAIKGNMERGLQYALKHSNEKSIWSAVEITPKSIVGLIVALMAAILPLFIKNRRYRLIQQLLNITVLGFWCGSFISYTSIIGYMSNGMNVIALLVPFVLLVVAFIYPLFGKKSYYCTNVCPFGSLQEVAGKCVKYKIKMKPKTAKRLDTFRQILWALLMLCLWTGVWSDWIDYEPFSAFIFSSASWIVITIAIVFVLLSTVIMRPYCRFVCPMGTLFKISQTSK